MTDIYSHVPDFETCKMLKEAGYPQESIFFYCVFPDGSSELRLKEGKISHLFQDVYFAAPIDSEILDKLPNKYALSKCGGINLNNDWTVFNCEDTDESETMDTNPATACALMWLKLRKENKL